MRRDRIFVEGWVRWKNIFFDGGRGEGDSGGG
jgi:hypothetical protein